MRGKEEDAIKVLAKISRVNKRRLPDDLLLQKPATPEKRTSFKPLFSSWKTAKKTLICWDLWYVFSICFYSPWTMALFDNLYLPFNIKRIFMYDSCKTEAETKVS